MKLKAILPTKLLITKQLKLARLATSTNSVATGVSLVNIRLSPSSTSDFYITVSRKLNQRSLKQGRSQEFCSGGASHWRCQISNFSYFAQRSFWCHWSISGLLQQNMTSNIFYQSASINFHKYKKTFAFAVIIIKQLFTKQFSMNIKSSGKRSAVLCCPREYHWLCLL